MATKVEGLFEAHVNLRNLEASIQFYRDHPGLELACLLEESRVAFFFMSAVQINLG